MLLCFSLLQENKNYDPIGLFCLFLYVCTELSCEDKQGAGDIFLKWV